MDWLNTLIKELRDFGQAIIDTLTLNTYPWYLPNAAKGRQFVYFAYVAEWLPIAALSTAIRNIQIQADSAFVITSIVAIETATNDTTFLANRPLLLNIKDTGSGRDYSSSPMAFDNWVGSAEHPYKITDDFPPIIAPNSTLQLQLQNLENVDRNVRYAIRGYKIFQYSPKSNNG